MATSRFSWGACQDAYRLRDILGEQLCSYLLYLEESERGRGYCEARAERQWRWGTRSGLWLNIAWHSAASSLLSRQQQQQQLRKKPVKLADLKEEWEFSPRQT